MKKYYLPILFVLALLPMSLYAGDKNVLGIMDLVAKEGVTQSDASILTGFVFDAAYKFGRGKYTIIARGQRDALLEEHEFSFTDLCDEVTCAIEAGKFLSADHVIVGSFTKFGSKYYVVVQIINVNTTEVEGSSRRGAADYEGIEQSVNDCIQELFGSAEPESIRAESPSKNLLAPEGFVLVEAGTFRMGSTNGSNDEKPVHSVTISRAYYISKYEVTQKEWKEVMGTNPSHFKGDNLPVENVSWYDAVEFCNALSRKEGLKPAYLGSRENIRCDFSVNGYRLPTEAEWEYAARGGNKSRGFTKAGSNSVWNVGWLGANSGGRTHDVGRMSPNELGIYDMSGNVWEWCWDWWEDYTSDSVTDPRGPSVGAYRISRGGSWFGTNDLRVAYRGEDHPSLRYNTDGFRVVRTAE